TRTGGGLEVPDPHLAWPGYRAARYRDPRRWRADRWRQRTGVGTAGDVRIGALDCTVGIPADPDRPGREDRVGAGAQLAARRTLPSPAAGVCTAIGRTATDRVAHCVAHRPRARTADRGIGSAARAGRIRARFTRRRGPVPVAADGIQKAARLLQP